VFASYNSKTTGDKIVKSLQCFKKFQVDVDILQGRKFSIKSESENDKIVDQISRDSKLFNIRLEQDVRLGYCKTVRPVIKNTIGGSSCLGPEFAGILSVEQSFSQLQPVNIADIPVSLLISVSVHQQ
jgi:hypothetical protein